MGNTPTAIAITPDGSVAYVCTENDDKVTPIHLATHTAGVPIVVGNAPNAIAITLNGNRAYIIDLVSSFRKIGQVNLITQTAGTQIDLGGTTAVPNNCIAITPDQAPTALFTQTVNGLKVSFDGSASSSPVGSIAKYDWDFGDGHVKTSSQPIVKHTYSSFGTFTATLTVTNTSGTSTRQTFTGQTVSNNGGPSAVFHASVVLRAPLPPPTFTGKIKKNVHKEKLSIQTWWKPSPSSKIRSYQVFARGKKIKTISAHHHKKALIHLSPHSFPSSVSEKYRQYIHNKYKIRSIGKGGTVSGFTPLTIE